MKILVTGGLSGLGLAITERLLNEGHEVVATYCNSKGSLEHSLLSTIQVDFADESSVVEFINRIPEMGVEALINNAMSGLVQKHAHKISGQEHLDMFQTNMVSTIDITNACLKIFRKQKQGKVINMLTAYLLDVPPTGMAQYTGLKAYLGALNKSWAAESIKFNVTSNAISPSVMKTNLTADTDARVFEQMEASHPLKRTLDPNEVTDAVVYLINASSFVNGTNMIINAGQNMM